MKGHGRTGAFPPTHHSGAQAEEPDKPPVPASLGNVPFGPRLSDGQFDVAFGIVAATHWPCSLTVPSILAGSQFGDIDKKNAEGVLSDYFLDIILNAAFYASFFFFLIL